MTRIWTGTASVVYGDASVELTGAALSDANCPADAQIVLDGATYFVASRTDTSHVELTRGYAGATGDVAAEIDPLTPKALSLVNVSTQLTEYDARLALLDARGHGLFYQALGNTAAGDPGPGKVARNAPDWADVTELYIDNLDASPIGVDQTPIIDQWGAGTLLIVESIATGAYSAFTLTTVPNAETGWRRLTGLERVGGVGTADGEDLRLVYVLAGTPGDPGLSAYQTAVLEGFVGDEAAWLATLNGDDGDDGDSAYEIAVANGFVGSETDWLASLEGADGADGAIGGSTSAADNRLLRSDGTGGATLQASAITVDDSGNMSGAVIITASGQVRGEAGDFAFIARRANDTFNSAASVKFERARTSLSSPSVVQSGDWIGQFVMSAWDGAAYQNAALLMTTAAENWSGTARGTIWEWHTTAPTTTTRAARLAVGTGLYHPSATGGDKGNNTINFGAVYDDNSLLTCMALQQEFLDAGEIDLPKWDALVPDLVVPEQRELVQVTYEVTTGRPVNVDELSEDGRIIRHVEVKQVTEERPYIWADPVYNAAGDMIAVVETPILNEVVTLAQIIVREHRTARLFKAMVDAGFDPRDPEQYFAKMRADEALPGMPTKQDWEQNGLSMGEQFGRKWLAMEMLAIVSNVMWLKLQDHEARIAALEKA